MAGTSRQRSIIEIHANKQACTLDQFKYPLLTPPPGRLLTGQPVKTLDTFTTRLDQELAVDDALFKALMPRMAAYDPQQTVLLMLLKNPPPPSMTPGRKEEYVEKTWREFWEHPHVQKFGESTFGTPNLPGNVMATVEANLRRAWEKEAKDGFASLKAGKQGVIQLGPHIKIYSHNISATGQLRKNARISIRTQNLPISVVHQLAQPFSAKSGGKTGAIRMSAHDLKKMDAAAAAVADARVQSSRILRSAGSKWGGGILAFAPTAAIDIYNNTKWQNGSLKVDGTSLMRDQVKNQTGNAVGFVAGAGIAAAAVSVGFVAAVGWPVVLIGLGGGIVAQTVWGLTMDDHVEDLAREHIR